MWSTNNWFVQDCYSAAIVFEIYLGNVFLLSLSLSSQLSTHPSKCHLFLSCHDGESIGDTLAVGRHGRYGCLLSCLATALALLCAFGSLATLDGWS